MTREEVAEAMAAPSELTIEGPFVTVNMANVVDVKHRNTLAALCRMQHEALKNEHLCADGTPVCNIQVEGTWLIEGASDCPTCAVIALMPTEGESDDTTTR